MQETEQCVFIPGVWRGLNQMKQILRKLATGIWTTVHQTSADLSVHSPNFAACVKMWLAFPAHAEPRELHQAGEWFLHPWDPCQALSHQEPGWGLSHTCRLAAITGKLESQGARSGGEGRLRDGGRGQVDRSVLAGYLPPEREEKEGFCPT